MRLRSSGQFASPLSTLCGRSFPVWQPGAAPVSRLRKVWTVPHLLECSQPQICGLTCFLIIVLRSVGAAGQMIFGRSNERVCDT